MNCKNLGLNFFREDLGSGPRSVEITDGMQWIDQRRRHRIERKSAHTIAFKFYLQGWALTEDAWKTQMGCDQSFDQSKKAKSIVSKA